MSWKNSNVKEWIPTLSYIRGDVDGDGGISMSDISIVMNYYLADDKPSDFNFEAADVNGDGYISISDVNQIMSMYLSGTSVEEYQVYTDKLSIRDNQNVQRSYAFRYDAVNRLTYADYSEERTDGASSSIVSDYSENCTYDLNSNITKMYRKGLMQNGTYGYVDNITLSYTGNQLTGIKENANAVTAEGSTDYKGEKAKQTSCTYNGMDSLTSDEGRGIALIEYDDISNPKVKGLFALTGRNP
jgi:hypothetical protein